MKLNAMILINFLAAFVCGLILVNNLDRGMWRIIGSLFCLSVFLAFTVLLIIRKILPRNNDSNAVE